MPQPLRASIREDWIDYNGHLRDAFYTLLASNAVDDLMDQVGLDAAYRTATGGTLYTVEMHVHFLQEVGRSDEVSVVSHGLGADAKRLHVRCEVTCPRLEGPAAVIEMLLLHVQQRPTPKSAPFPETVARRLAGWVGQSQRTTDEFGSRAIGLRRPGSA